jgi:hypothetical protein
MFCYVVQCQYICRMQSLAMIKLLATVLLAAATVAQPPYYEYSMATHFTIGVVVKGKNSLQFPSEYAQNVTLSSDVVGMNRGSLVGIPNGDTTITVTASGKVTPQGAVVPLYRGATSKNVTSGTVTGFLITLMNLNAAPTVNNTCPFITSVSVDPGVAVRHAPGDTPAPSKFTVAALDDDGAIASTGFTNKSVLSAADSVVGDCGDADTNTYCFKAGVDEELKEHPFELSVTDDDANAPCTSSIDIDIEVVKRKNTLVVDFNRLHPTVVSMYGTSGHVIANGDSLDVTFNVEATPGTTLTVTGNVKCTGQPDNPIKDGSNNDYTCATPSACVVSVPFQGRAASERCVAEFVFTDTAGHVSDSAEYVFYSGQPTLSHAPHIVFAFVSDVDFTVNGTDFSLVAHVVDENNDLTTPVWSCGDLASGAGTPVTGGSGSISTFTYTNVVTDPTVVSPHCTFRISRGGAELVKTFNFNTPFPAGYPTPVPTPVASCTLSADACVHGQMEEVSGPVWAYITSGHRPSNVQLTAGSVIVIHTTEAVAFHASVPPAIVAALNACGEIEAHVESVTYDTSNNVRVMGINRLFYDDVWHNNTAIFTDTQLSDTSFRVVSAPLVSSGHVLVTSLCDDDNTPRSSQLLTVPEYATAPADEACHMEFGFNISREVVDKSDTCHVGWIVHNDTSCDTSNVIGLPCDDLCVPYGSEYLQAKSTDGRIQFYSDVTCSTEVPGKSLAVTGDLHNYVSSTILQNNNSHYALQLYP